MVTSALSLDPSTPLERGSSTIYNLVYFFLFQMLIYQSPKAEKQKKEE